MAKLYLKFEQAVLKEFELAEGVVTIGRLPDNRIQVDNLAVSGHHAKIYWETDHYTLEDNNSLNGTFVNNRRVSKTVLKDGDEVLIGKHTVLFKDEGTRTQATATEITSAHGADAGSHGGARHPKGEGDDGAPGPDSAARRRAGVVPPRRRRLPRTAPEC